MNFGNYLFTSSTRLFSPMKKYYFFLALIFFLYCCHTGKWRNKIWNIPGCLLYRTTFALWHYTSSKRWHFFECLHCFLCVRNLPNEFSSVWPGKKNTETCNKNLVYQKVLFFSLSFLFTPLLPLAACCFFVCSSVRIRRKENIADTVRGESLPYWQLLNEKYFDALQGGKNIERLHVERTLLPTKIQRMIQIKTFWYFLMYFLANFTDEDSWLEQAILESSNFFWYFFSFSFLVRR